MLKKRGTGTKVKLETDRRTFYKKLPSIISHLGLETVNGSFNKGYLVAKNGITLLSWGEFVAVFFEEISKDELNVEVVSERVLITNITATNWEDPIINELLKRFNPRVYRLIKECDSDDYVACRKLGILYILGDGVHKNFKKAFNLIDDSCDGDNYYSCFYLGSLYYKGDYVPKDYKKAEKYFKIACKGGMERACKAYGILYDKD